MDRWMDYSGCTVRHVFLPSAQISKVVGDTRLWVGFPMTISCGVLCNPSGFQAVEWTQSKWLLGLSISWFQLQEAAWGVPGSKNENLLSDTGKCRPQLQGWVTLGMLFSLYQILFSHLENDRTNSFLLIGLMSIRLNTGC